MLNQKIDGAIDSQFISAITCTFENQQRCIMSYRFLGNDLAIILARQLDHFSAVAPGSYDLGNGFRRGPERIVVEVCVPGGGCRLGMTDERTDDWQA